MMSRRYRPAFAVAVLSMLLGTAGAVSGQAPQTQAPMNMANMDQRGGIRGTVRGANNAPVADTAVTAVDATTGARFEAMTDAQGAYAFGALPVGSYNITVLSAGLTAFRRQGVAVTADQNVQLDITLDAASAAQAADAERQELLQQVADLKQRVTDLESNTVLSEPETRVRRVEVYVDENGNEHDEQVPGSTPAITYRRERVYRRQTINEKIEEALADAEKHSVGIGVDAAITTQYAKRTKGGDRPGGQPCVRPGVRRSVLHRRDRAEHGVLRRHRRPERRAAGRGDSEPHAAERIHGPPGSAERTEPPRGVVADRALRPAAGA